MRVGVAYGSEWEVSSRGAVVGELSDEVLQKAANWNKKSYDH
jgi:hypothetical protein